MSRRRLPPSRQSTVAKAATAAVRAPEALPAETADEKARREHAVALASAVTAARRSFVV